jgi:hypothetical protein
VNRRFHIVIAQGRPSEAGNTARVKPLGRFKTLMAGFALVTLALAVLVAGIILGYIMAVILSLIVIVVIAVVFVKALFRRRRAAAAARHV